jgi:microcystin-dependent protein
MSIVLDAILAQAADQYPYTVALSPESVTVLLYASGFLEERRNWLDERADPLDEITPEEWDTIEALVAGLYYEVNNPLLGLIFPIMTAEPPANCLLCDGSTYAREDYPLLYAAIDPAFIVDADFFVVPDLRRKKPRGADPLAGVDPIPVGATGGQETVTLTTAEMPSHTHEPIPHQHTVGAGISILAIAPGEAPVQTPNIPFTDLTGFASAEVLPIGGDGAHDNLDPFIALNFAVVAL